MSHPHGKLDMTQGPILRRAMMFALPICLGNLLQQLYSTVDTMVVGNFCGRESLAAVGTSAQPIEILLCVFMGMGAGVSILVSQYTGSGDQQNLRRIISNATTLNYCCAIPLSLLGMLLGPAILTLMQVPADAFDASVTYIRLLLLGTLFNLGYNTNAGILRGLGDSRSTLWFLLISCGINIVLDLLFVAVLRMDVQGAAIATIIAQGISWVISVWYLRSRYADLDYSPMPSPMHRDMVTNILRIGLPLGLNNSLYSVGHIFMQSLINLQGTAFMAACSVAGKVNSMASLAITSLSSAAATFAGQNYGARNYRRLVRGGWQIPLFSAAITCTAGLLVTLCCKPLLALFNQDPEVINLGAIYVRVVLPFSWMYAMLNGIINICNGLSVIRYPTIVNLMMLWGMRIPTAFLIAHFFNGLYVMAALPISFAFGMICMLLFYLTPKWQDIRSLAKSQPVDSPAC